MGLYHTPGRVGVVRVGPGGSLGGQWGLVYPCLGRVGLNRVLFASALQAASSLQLWSSLAPVLSAFLGRRTLQLQRPAPLLCCDRGAIVATRTAVLLAPHETRAALPDNINDSRAAPRPLSSVVSPMMLPAHEARGAKGHPAVLGPTGPEP